MLLKQKKKLKSLKQEVIKRGYAYYSLAREIYEAGKKVYEERKRSEKPSETTSQAKKTLRKHPKSNFSVPNPDDPAELARQTSLSSHQLKERSPGEKFNSNMRQRNYDNHQGN